MPREDSGETLADLLERRAGDDRPGLLSEDRVWSWREYVAECRERAARMDALAVEGGTGEGPAGEGRTGEGATGDGRAGDRRALHVGVLFDNVPELLFLLGGAALSGHVIVALNPTRGAAELARDADATDVDLILNDPGYADLAARVAGLRASAGEGGRSGRRPGPESRGGAGAPPGTGPGDLVMLIFTSGTSGRPRAVRVTQRKIAVPGTNLAALLSPRDVVHCSMPLFHSGAIMAAYAPAVASGAALVLRRRFSASGLMDDVRRYGVTYLHYVGKALSYVLATPATPGDRDNTLKIAFGNEGSAAATRRFGERFGCYVIDAFGSTETAIAITPDPSGPAGCLGRLPEGVEIRDPAGGRCPPAVIEDGRLLNGDEAIGELVNTRDLGLFDGYYNDPEADRERIRDGAFWSGDMAYADENGYVFFAGRGTERLRVDGENLAVAPIEAAVREFPGVVEAAVYPVPDAEAGDQVMVAVVTGPSTVTGPPAVTGEAQSSEALSSGGAPSPAGGRDDTGGDWDGGWDAEAVTAFAEFLAARADLSRKALPRYVRLSAELPQTPSHKVVKRLLVAEAWRTGDPVWWRPPREPDWRRLTPEDVKQIENEFVANGREHLLER
ncbi:AMP-binding protein [Planobispora takensis]|uniref:Acyl-CoA synthetase n=1 Tax=Planobispora takensis TaxID=1367882 RepID=A0A8J3SXX6_9ACTN|nr:AMP-binding protein [Planobispora takensis]GII02684.1 acyl-CoA synthetase [Planobispora takensis]